MVLERRQCFTAAEQERDEEVKRLKHLILTNREYEKLNTLKRVYEDRDIQKRARRVAEGRLKRIGVAFEPLGDIADGSLALSHVPRARKIDQLILNLRHAITGGDALGADGALVRDPTARVEREQTPRRPTARGAR